MHRAFGIALLVALAVAAPLVGGPAAAQDGDATPTANESDVRHVNPDGAGDEGNLERVQSHLAGQLAERLSQSSVQISQGQYDRAKGLLGEEYRDTFSKYVDVAGETGEEDSADRFRETRERQREFAGSAQNYTETLAEYREAKRNGNERRARQLARELERTAENVTEASRRVKESYDRLSNRTGANLTEADAAVDRTVANVTEQQAEVRAAEFVATTLSVEAVSTRASFADPMVAAGRLARANGTAVAGREITLRVGNRTVAVETDARGRFSFRYRPVTLPADAERVEVRYVPNDTSVLGGSNASVPIEVVPVRSSVRLANGTASAAYNESVGATARVTAAGRPVPGLPVTLAVDGRTLARGRTAADGTVRLAGRLPASVGAGERELRVAAPLTDRAVRPSSATGTLAVRETATDLTVTAAPRDGQVAVGGRLTTVDGEPAAGATVEIRRDGSLVTTARTGADGRFVATVEGSPGERYRIAAVQDDPSTNLGASRAATAVAMPGAGNGTPATAEEGRWASLLDAVGGLPTDDLLYAGGALAVLLVGGLVLWWYPTGSGGTGESASVERAIRRVDEPPSDPDADVVADARSLLERDATAAVERAYRGVRAALRGRGVGDPAATHWEFYRACRDEGVADAAALEALTVAYERAAFGRGELSSDEAREALDRASRLT